MKKNIGIASLLLCLTMGFGMAQQQGGQRPETMDGNTVYDVFGETQRDDEYFSYIDAFVTLRKDPNEETNTVSPLGFRQEIIRTFCDTVLRMRKDENNISVYNGSENADKEDLDWYFDHQGYRYDPRTSMIVYSICVGFDERRVGMNGYKNYKSEDFYSQRIQYPTGVNGQLEGDFIMNDHRKWIREGDPTQLLQAWGLPEKSVLDTELTTNRYPCDPKKDMNRCNFSSWTTTLYQNIMDELVTMRQAAIYGYRFYNAKDDDPAEDSKIDQEKALDMAVQAFAYKYFMDGNDGEETCNDKKIHYLNAGEVASENGGSNGSDQTIVEGDTKHCYHPKTEKIVRDTIKDQYTMLQSIEFLEPREFFQHSCDYAGGNTLNTSLRCALSLYQVKPGMNDQQSFHNVLLNEAMWYNIFITYYLNNITSNNSLSSSVGIVTAMSQTRDEVSILTYEQKLATQAINTTMRMLNNIQGTYPIHIGLLAYLEDVQAYRKQLSKVYTPMHQLSYILRNAQECSE